MNEIKLRQQQGFSILAIILIIVAVVVAIGVWAMSGQTNTSNSSNSSSDLQAASIVSDAGSIKLSFDTLMINGANPINITFIPNIPSTSSTQNMLDPTTGIGLPQPNKNAIRYGANVPDSIWVYNASDFIGQNIGTSAADPVIVLAGIKDTVCQRINNTLYGNTAIPAFLTVNSANFVVNATLKDPNTNANIDLNTISSGVIPNGWSSGCISASGVTDHNMYYRILKIN